MSKQFFRISNQGQFRWVRSNYWQRSHARTRGGLGTDFFHKVGAKLGKRNGQITEKLAMSFSMCYLLGFLLNNRFQEKTIDCLF
jgi:hypothetical protein